MLLALYFLLPASQLGLGAWFDQANFRLWSTLFPAEQQPVSERLRLVTLPEAVTAAQLPSLAVTEELTGVIAAVSDHGAAAIGILPDLGEVIWPGQEVQALLAEPGEKQHPKLVLPYLRLQDLLQSQPVAWLHAPELLPTRPLLIDREFSSPLIFNLHDRLLQYRFTHHSDTPYQTRLFSYDQGQILAGFELSLLALARDTNSLRWQIPDQMRVGAIDKPVSTYGTVRPWPQVQAAATLQGSALAVDQLNDQQVAGKIVLLANDTTPELATTLATVNAIFTNQYSYSPWWQFLALLPLTLLLWMYVLFAFRRFTGPALAVSAIAITALLAALSITLQEQFGVWLESGDVMVYNLLMSLVLLVHSGLRSWQIRSRMEADDARLELAQLYLEQNNPRSASDQLLLTSMSEDTADLLMETGKAFERKRDYQAARETYNTVYNHFPGHPTAGEALDDISSITGQHPSLNSTLILPDMPVEMPQLGRYELIRPLGKGAMGAVYLANDPTIRREVAIKTLMLNELGDDRDELRERFLREAETAGRLQHPNIATVYDVGEEGDLAFIAMDYVPGGTLADWVQEDDLLELGTLYQVMEQVCQALGYAHKEGVVHRDIKPGNILYDPDTMTVKVTDFGIASLADYSRTKTGAILGSPYYMSPEQVSGKKVGPATDLYSLGVTFYQLLSGNLPFEADSLAQLAWQITNKPHRNIGRLRRGLPRSATRIVNTALKKNPSDRYKDAGEMGTAFAKGGKGLGTPQKHSA